MALWFSKSNCKILISKRERVKYTEAQMRKAAWIKSVTEFILTGELSRITVRCHNLIHLWKANATSGNFSCQVCLFQVDGVRVNAIGIHMIFSQSKRPRRLSFLLIGSFWENRQAKMLEVKRHQPWRNDGDKQPQAVYLNNSWICEWIHENVSL